MEKSKLEQHPVSPLEDAEAQSGTATEAQWANVSRLCELTRRSLPPADISLEAMRHYIETLSTLQFRM
jgi:hypothetical protein